VFVWFINGGEVSKREALEEDRDCLIYDIEKINNQLGDNRNKGNFESVEKFEKWRRDAVEVRTSKNRELRRVKRKLARLRRRGEFSSDTDQEVCLRTRPIEAIQTLWMLLKRVGAMNAMRPDEKSFFDEVKAQLQEIENGNR
jgi:hypothetical protein